MDNLNEMASKLARNPLGIIALFIVLVYGIAGIVLGASSEFLSENQRSVFVWFLVLFPFVVFIGFLWLVSKHHTKLYAPTDFKDEEGFLRSSKYWDTVPHEDISITTNALHKLRESMEMDQGLSWGITLKETKNIIGHFILHSWNTAKDQTQFRLHHKLRILGERPRQRSTIFSYRLLFY